MCVFGLHLTSLLPNTTTTLVNANPQVTSTTTHAVPVAVDYSPQFIKTKNICMYV